jgi:C4-dicarboxylate-specific signal transduction histidine kinase
MPRRPSHRKKSTRTRSRKAPPSHRLRTVEEELKRLRSQVKELEPLAAIGELSITVARQAWNPLTSLALSIDLLARRTEDAEVLAKLAQIDGERKRVADVLKDFLEFAKFRRRGKKP